MPAGELTYKTTLDTNGFKKGINDINNQAQSGGTKMRSIIAALGITKLISTAFDTIRNSMDAAISRLDTMNNFPKVMSNLGISAKDSDKAIKDLSTGLKGLPTTLDAGALAVQRFTSKNGDVKKSTELFLALNNAILAGGASTQIQETAIEQLSQAYSKGKPDMMEWRSIQTAMPAQLKQISTQMLGNKDALNQYLEKAKEYAANNPLSSTAAELIEQLEAVSNGTGDMTTALGTGLRTGIISMDDFMDTIVQMNKTGSGNIKSFEEQAKNSTGGIRTNITNMKTAIARGVANIITTLDKALKKANLKGVGESIKSIGETAEKWLGKISKTIEKVNFKSLLNILKSLIPIVGSVVAAFIAYETTLKAIQLINMVTNITKTAMAFMSLIPEITSAREAMMLLNMTFNANPIGLVVAGITALIGVLVLSHKAFGEQQTQVEKNNQTLEDYKNEMQDIEKERDKYLKSNLGEIQNYQNLSRELENLVDENGKVKKGYEERAKFIVTTLNGALGTEMKLNDGVLQGHKDIKKAIDDLLVSKRAKVLLDAHEHEYNKAIEKEADLLKELNSATKEQEKAQSKLDNWVKQTAEHYGLTNNEMLELLNTNDIFNQSLPISGDELINLQSKFNGLNNSVNQANKSLSDSKKVYDENQLKIIDYELALQGFSDKNYDVVSKIYNDTVDYHGKTNADNYAKYQESINTMTEYLNRLKEDRNKYSEEEYNALVSAGQAKLDELKKQQDQYKTVTEDGQNKQKEAVKKGQSKVKDIWKMSAEEQINYLKGKKVEFKQTADGHIQAFVDGQSSGKPKTKKEAKKMMDDIKSEIDKAKKYGDQGGFDFTAGTTGGIKRGQGSTFSAVQNYGNTIISTLKNALREKSPSKASKEMGQYLIEGFEIGVEDEQNQAFKQIDNFGSEVLDRFSNAVNLETGKMSFNGTTGTVSQILSANAQFEGTIPLQVDLDGEKIYENQQKISARKSLQYGGAK